MQAVVDNNAMVRKRTRMLFDIIMAFAIVAIIVHYRSPENTRAQELLGFINLTLAPVCSLLTLAELTETLREYAKTVPRDGGAWSGGITRLDVRIGVTSFLVGVVAAWIFRGNSSSWFTRWYALGGVLLGAWIVIVWLRLTHTEELKSALNLLDDLTDEVFYGFMQYILAVATVVSLALALLTMAVDIPALSEAMTDYGKITADIVASTCVVWTLVRLRGIMNINVTELQNATPRLLNPRKPVLPERVPLRV